jgi:hypothetical protein
MIKIGDIEIFLAYTGGAKFHILDQLTKMAEIIHGLNFAPLELIE